MNAELIEQLAAYTTPSPLPVHLDEHREQRNWVVRLAADPIDGWNPERTAVLLTARATAAVRSAREACGFLTEDSRHVPVVRLVRIDKRHVVMNVLTVKLQNDDAHAYLVAASAALRALDEVNPIDDIQGIPRRFWKVLL